MVEGEQTLEVGSVDHSIPVISQQGVDALLAKHQEARQEGIAAHLVARESGEEIPEVQLVSIGCAEVQDLVRPNPVEHIDVRPLSAAKRIAADATDQRVVSSSAGE